MGYDLNALQQQLNSIQRQYQQLQSQNQNQSFQLTPPSPPQIPHQIQYVEGLSAAYLIKEAVK